MSTVWQFGTSPSFSKHYESVVDRGGYYVWIENINDLHASLQAFRGRGPECSGGMDPEVSSTELNAMISVMPVMALHLDGFAPDLVDEFGLLVFSDRLRDALGVGPDQIAFVPVDTSRSDEHIQAKKYEIGLVLPKRDVIDLERSDIEWSYPRKEAAERMGAELLARIASTPGLAGFYDLPEKSISMARTVVPKQNPDLDVDIFIERTLGCVCVTEAAAQRIVDAGIDDAGFTQLDFKLGEMPRVRARDGQLKEWGA